MNKNMNILVVDGFSTMRRIVKNLLHNDAARFTAALDALGALLADLGM